MDPRFNSLGRRFCAPLLLLLVVVLGGEARGVDSAARRASVIKCQSTVVAAGEQLVVRYSEALGACLQKINSEIMMGYPVTKAVGPCSQQLARLLPADRQTTGTLARFERAILAGCRRPSHDTEDLLGPGGTVLQPLGAATLGGFCSGFGGNGAIGTLEAWIDCLREAHLCQARQAIALQYPRGREWLGLVYPGAVARDPAVGALILELIREIYGSGDTPILACGSPRAEEVRSCQADLGACRESALACLGLLGGCTTALAPCVAGNALVSEVRGGRTFSSASGLGVAGMMPDRVGATVLPSVSDQAIAAGYHSGLGSVVGDGDLQPDNVREGVEVFGVTGTASSGLLQTGQTTAYGSGSDGSVRTGRSRAYRDNGDGTISDLRTGLVWEKKSDDGGIHDKDNRYVWGELSPPYAMNGAMVSELLAGLNTPPCFASHCDWRIPNEAELHSLSDIETDGLAANAIFHTPCVADCSVMDCSCMATTYTWSSTTRADFPERAWAVSFRDGEVGHWSKDQAYAVQVVRGGW